ncbi:hypothetical protein ACFPM1_04920 [Halorubrum rubrum]|uniref:Uncharacterized protein n=1 Tax=Halorubrum rubrum TaxID=1126240 RepID=A0ABD5QZI2_9EURY|nr:hypothetical protein [Halorubrum rubrum]
MTDDARGHARRIAEQLAMYDDEDDENDEDDDGDGKTEGSE